LMLSSQTKDRATATAMTKLKAHGLTVENIIQTTAARIDELIAGVGFHQRKAAYIKQASSILHDKYNDDIPSTFEELMKLPGVGPKMSFLCMQVAWKKSVGIAVDVHVHRISNRLHWVNNTKTPEKTRKELEAWIPHEYWRPLNNW